MEVPQVPSHPSAVAGVGSLAKLKGELVDLVSGFLMKEPPFGCAGATPGFDDTGSPLPTPNHLAAASAEGKRSGSQAAGEGGGEDSDGSPLREEEEEMKEAEEEEEEEGPKRSDEDEFGVGQVERLRELVHAISLHDGEFCLKTALFLRQELDIRRTACFLSALCAREPKCRPFLQCYVERVVSLPSDWLSIANFAYYHDSDYEHVKWAVGRKREEERQQRARQQRQRERMQLGRPRRDVGHMRSRSGPPRLSSSSTSSRSSRAAAAGVDAQLTKRSAPLSSSSSLPQQQQHLSAAELADIARKEEEREEVQRLKRRHLPRPLRRCLVNVFASFDEFSLAKYNNESAEKKKRRRRARDTPKRSGQGPLSHRGAMGNGGGDGDGEGEGAPDDSSRTFTYKQLIRMLHISEPAYEVCCLLGKRYPSSQEAFDQRFNKTQPSSAEAQRRRGRRRVFDPSKAGKRMALEVPKTWETELASRGNVGEVWDSLVQRNQLPFMAMLRNLRNLLTRNCADSTYETLIARLRSEEQVARSRQLPYRFFSAYTAVEQTSQDHSFTMSLGSRWKRVCAQFPGLAPAELNRLVRRRIFAARGSGRPSMKLSEVPVKRSLKEQLSLMARFKGALNTAVDLATRLNVIPMKGVSAVILTLSPSLLETLRAAGGGAGIGSVRTKLEAAALLAIMMRRACETCVVVVFAFTEYFVYDPNQPPNTLHEVSEGEEEEGEGSSSTSDEPLHGGGEGANNLLEEVRQLASTCKKVLRRWRRKAAFASPWRARPDTGAAFPFPFLDQIIERRTELTALMVIDDDGHHTYSGMNTSAPALGDLPVYLSRLRRACSPNLVYVGVAITAPSDAPLAEKCRPRPSAKGRALPDGFHCMAEEREAKVRFTHRNDALLTGFSDAILRLVAERAGGGTVAVVERADVTFHVDKTPLQRAHVTAEQRNALMEGFRSIQRKGPSSAPPPPRSPAAKTKEATATEPPLTRVQFVVPPPLSPAKHPVRALGLRKPLRGEGGPSTTEGRESRRWPVPSPLGALEEEEEEEGKRGAVGEDDGKAYSGDSFQSKCLMASTKRLLLTAPFAMKRETPLSATAPLDGLQPYGGVLSDDDDDDGGDGDEESSARVDTGKRAPQLVYHPTPFITLSRASSSRSERAVPLKRTLRRTASAEAAQQRPRPAKEEVEGEDAAAPGSSTLASQDRSLPLRPPWGLPTPDYFFQECRFFISSTFLDMNNERNALILDVFPRIRRWAAASGIRVTILEVDLRWGITADSTSENLSTSVCLNEVSRCAPFLLSILGSRYGSCPSPLQVVADEDVSLSDFAWLKDLPAEMEGAVSVTELEVRHGIYNAVQRWRHALGIANDHADADGNAAFSPPTVLVFCRDAECLLRSLPDDERREVYQPDTPLSQERIRRLTAYIRDCGIPILDYTATFDAPTDVTANSAADGGDGPEVSGTAAAAAVAAASLFESSEMGVTAMPQHEWSSPRAIASGPAFACVTSGGSLALPPLPVGTNGGQQRRPSAMEGGGGGGDGDSAEARPEAGYRGGGGRPLTSVDVPLNMEGFAATAYAAIQRAILSVCNRRGSGVEVEGSLEGNGACMTATHEGDADSSSGVTSSPVAAARDSAFAELRLRQQREEEEEEEEEEERRRAGDTSKGFYAAHVADTARYASDLCRVYVPPEGFMERLAAFALDFAVDADGPGEEEGGRGDRRNSDTEGFAAYAEQWKESSSSDGDDDDVGGDGALAGTSGGRRESMPQRPPGAASAVPEWRLTEQTKGGAGVAAAEAGLPVVHGASSSGNSGVLVVEAGDGDGKSSALAMLARRLAARHPRSPQRICVVHYAAQASDGSLRSLLLFLAVSLLCQGELYDELPVSESETTTVLLELLPRIYEALKKKGKPAVVLLDGLEQCGEAEDIVKHLGAIVHPLAAPDIRFIVSSSALSPLVIALTARVPPAQTARVPLLSWEERAEVVRRHLATYGKRLQESTIGGNELHGLLRKRDASSPSYLTSAITYLRLFSSFDTLREDIGRLPSGTSKLYMEFLRELEARFGEGGTCRLLLTTLYMRQAVGGIMEHNLYRLVSHVAVSSRLVALLAGTCIVSVHGRLLLSGSFFKSAIAQSYLRSLLDERLAYESMVAAELMYRPLHAVGGSGSGGGALEAAAAVDGRAALRAVVESIRVNAVDPRVPSLFSPLRYTPHELLSILHCALLAERADVAVALACYLPYVEGLLRDRTMLPRLLHLLSQLLRRCRSGETAAKAASVVWFLKQNYHVLYLQPELLCQCRLNAPADAHALSLYSTAVVLRLSGEADAVRVLEREGSDDNGDNDKEEEESHKEGLHPDRKREAEAAPSPSSSSSSPSSSSWIRWNRVEQHDEETRVFSASPSASPILCLTTSPDGSLVAFGCQDHLLRVAPSDSPEHLIASLKHLSAVTAVSFLLRRTPATAVAGSPNSGDDGGGRAEGQQQPPRRQQEWSRGGDSDTGAEDSPHPPRSYDTGPHAEDDGSGSGSGRGSGGRALGGRVSADKLLVSGCEQGLFYLWSLEDGSLLQVGAAHLRAVTSIACHPTESVVCTGSTDTYAMLWSVLGTESGMSITLRRHMQRMLREAEESNARSKADGACSQRLQLLKSYRKTPGSSLSRFALSSLSGRRTALRPFGVLRHSASPIAAVAFHSSGELLATGAWDGAVFLLSTSDVAPHRGGGGGPLPPRCQRGGQRAADDVEAVFRLPYEHQRFDLASPVRALGFVPSKVVTCAVGTLDGAITLIDHASGVVSATLTSLHLSPITALAFSPDGLLMASADAQGKVKVTYAGVTGTEVGSVIRGHQRAVTGLCFTAPVGSDAPAPPFASVKSPWLLLSSSMDLTIQAWALRPDAGSAAAPPSASSSLPSASTTPAVALRSAHSSVVTCVAVAADARRFVTGCADGMAFVFAPPADVNGGVRLRASTLPFRKKQQTMRSSNDLDPVEQAEEEREEAEEEEAEEEEEELPISFDAGTCAQPSFALSHNGCRVSCLAFALHDTRIVAGLSFGHVYVWASTPGLNRCEGRLLQRVRVPTQGLSPVVSLEVHNLEDTFTRLRGGRTRRWHGKGVDGREEEKRGDAGWRRAEGVLGAREGPGLAPLATTAQVTAFCSSGDTARFCVYADSVSSALLREGCRRLKRDSAAWGCERKRAPTKGRSRSCSCASTSSSSASSSSSSSRPASSRAPTQPGRQGGERVRRLSTAAFAQDAEEEARQHRRQPLAMREGTVFPVERAGLTWLDVRGNAEGNGERGGKPNNGGADAGADVGAETVPMSGEETVAVVPLFFCLRAHAAAKRPFESGFHGGPASLVRDGAADGVFTMNSPDSQSTSGHGDGPGEGTSPALGEDAVLDHVNCTSSSSSKLFVESHRSLLVGQRRLYIVTHRAHCATPLPIHLHPALAGRPEASMLGSDEVYVCVSSLVQCAYPDREHGASFTGFVAAATSEGRLMVLQVHYNGGSTEASGGADGDPVAGDGSGNHSAEALALLSQEVTVTLVFSHFFASNRADGGAVSIAAVDLSVLPVEQPSTASATTRLPRKRCASASADLKVVVGCADAAVRVLTLRLSNESLRRPMEPAADVGRRGGGGACLGGLLFNERRHSASRGSGDPPPPPRLLTSNVFAASAALTAASVLSPNPRGRLFHLAANDDNDDNDDNATAPVEDEGGTAQALLRGTAPPSSAGPLGRATIHRHAEPAGRGRARTMSRAWDRRRRQTLMFLVGDSLGRVYQLWLEQESDFLSRLRAEAAQDPILWGLAQTRTAAAATTSGHLDYDEEVPTRMRVRRWHRQRLSMGLDVYTQAEERLLAVGGFAEEATSSGGGGGAAAAEAIMGACGDRQKTRHGSALSLRGWAWQSASPLAWLRPVDLSAPSLPGSLLPSSFSAPAAGEVKASVGGKPPPPPPLQQQPSPLEGPTTAASTADLKTELSITRTKKTSPSLYAFLESSNRPRWVSPSPAPLPSLYTEKNLSEVMKEFDLLPNMTFGETTATRRGSVGQQEGVETGVGGGEPQPEKQTDVVVLSLKKGEESKEADVADGASHLPIVPADSYFSVLTQSSPPSVSVRCSPQERTDWRRRQHAVLKEAIRVQHYNAEARLALQVYNSQVLSAMSL